MNAMPADDEIRELFQGMDVVEVSSDVPTGHYTIGRGTLTELREFATRVGVSVLFVEKMFLDVEDLIITDQMYRGLSLEILGGVQFDSHRFNRDIREVDLSSPVEMRVFILYEGRAFGVFFLDKDLDSLRTMSPQERVAEFAEARRQKLKNNPGIYVPREDPRHEKFSEVLVLDSMFMAIKDEQERVNYVIKISRRPGNDVLRKSIMKADGSGFSLEKIRNVLRIVSDKTDLSRPVRKQLVFE